MQDQRAYGENEDIAGQRLYRKDDFGYNAHEIYDILGIVGASPGALMGKSQGLGGVTSTL